MSNKKRCIEFTFRNRVDAEIGYNQLKGLVINNNRVFVGFAFEKQELSKELEAETDQGDGLSKSDDLAKTLSSTKTELIPDTSSQKPEMESVSNSISAMPVSTNSNLSISPNTSHLTNPGSSSISNTHSIPNTSKSNLDSNDSNIDKTNILYISNLHTDATIDDLKGLSNRIQNAFFEEAGNLR